MADPETGKDLVFVVSGGRTGTTFFGQKLGQIVEDCFSVHEPDLKYGWRDRRTWQNIATFGPWHMVIGRALGLTGAMATARQHLAGRLPREKAVRRIRAGRIAYHRGRPEGLIVEANSQWSPILPVLRDAFPAAKIVCVKRDQESWVRSWLNYFPRHAPEDTVSPRKRVTPVTIGAPEAADWPVMSQEDRLRWEWRFVTDRITAFAEADPLARLYAYEDLFLGDGVALTDMLDFVTAHEGRSYRYRLGEAFLEDRVNRS